jgi:hypothetical protein
MIYPDVLTKHTQNDYDLNGIPLSKEKFLKGMQRCGFDVDVTRQMLCLLKLNGTWFLALNEKQKRTIFNSKISPASRLGFDITSV